MGQNSCRQIPTRLADIQAIYPCRQSPTRLADLCPFWCNLVQFACFGPIWCNLVRHVVTWWAPWWPNGVWIRRPGLQVAHQIPETKSPHGWLNPHEGHKRPNGAICPQKFSHLSEWILPQMYEIWRNPHTAGQKQLGTTTG